MSTTPLSDGTTASTLDEQFLDLVYSDPQLLAAEFEEIIAAEWSQPPADRPGLPSFLVPSPGRAAGRTPVRSRVPTDPRPGCLGACGWSRQRSPPQAPMPSSR